MNYSSASASLSGSMLALSSSSRIMHSASAKRRADSVRLQPGAGRALGTVSVALGANTGRSQPSPRAQRQKEARPTPVRAAISP
jgi:hypothetical protein